jgi:hypothetical protein
MKTWRLSMEEAHSSKRSGRGIRLEDVLECFACCATNIEDEQKIREAFIPVVQTIYNRAQDLTDSFEKGQVGSVNAVDIIRLTELKSVKYVPRVRWVRCGFRVFPSLAMWYRKNWGLLCKNILVRRQNSSGSLKSM